MSTGISIIHRTAEAIQAESITAKLAKFCEIIEQEIDKTPNPLIGRFNTVDLKLRLTIRILEVLSHEG